MVKKKRSRAKRKDFKEKCYKHPHGMTGGVYFLAFIGTRGSNPLPSAIIINGFACRQAGIPLSPPENI